jgi:P-type conjugative transfer protein VirB9
MKKSLFALVACLPFLHQLSHAEIAATPLPGDTRLVVFTYDPHNSYQVMTRPKSVTDIQFNGEERVKALALGDTIQWEVAKTGDGQHLFIKPKVENIRTSATVITDKRSYQLLLTSTTTEGKWYQRVSWEYPELVLLNELEQAQVTDKAAAEQSRLDAQTMAKGVTIEDMNFRYEIEGEAPFKPSGVMDDGKFTYIRMPSQLQELPALFMVSPEGDAELINYIVKGEYLVVQRLVDRVLLKIGKQEVKVVNSKTTRAGFFGLFKGD